MEPSTQDVQINAPKVIHTFNGWVLTNTGIVSCACLTGPFDTSIVRCPRCAKWITEKIFKHMERVWEFTKTPNMYPLSNPGRHHAHRR